MFRRILVTLDGSEFAEAALPAAAGLARKTGAQLRLLTVHDSGWALVDGEWSDAARIRARRYLESMRELVEPIGHDVSTCVRDGFAVEEILAEADTFDADLIVMATHGRGPMSRFWLGSVADQCVRRGHRPLLLVRPRAAGEAPSAPLTVGRVVVPLDGSELSERALGRAMEVARLFDSPMTLLRVLPDQSALASEIFPPEAANLAVEWAAEAKEEAARYLSEVSAWLVEWGIQPSARVEDDGEAVPEAIVHEAHGDLVVMATHARTGLGRAFLGSVADAVVRSATGPVLVIPPETVPGPAVGRTRARTTRLAASA